MGKVALVLKVMPKGPDINLAKLKESIKSVGNVQEINEKPIGFGLVGLEVLLVFEDKEGIGNIEEKIKNLEGVESVEAGDVTLL